MRVKRLFLVALGMSCAGSPVLACTLTAGGMSFGTINPLMMTDHTAVSTISVACPEPTAYSIQLSAGNGSYATRELVAGAAVLEYNLFLDASFTQVWGDGLGAGDAAEGASGPAGANHSVYGKVTWQPGVMPGQYADTIVVTLEF